MPSAVIRECTMKGHHSLSLGPPRRGVTPFPPTVNGLQSPLPVSFTLGHNLAFPRGGGGGARFSLLALQGSHDSPVPTGNICPLFTEDPVVKKFLAWDKRLEVSDKVNHPLRWIPAPAPVLGGRTGCFLHPRFHSPPNLMPCQHFPPGASRSPLGSEPQVCPFGGCGVSPLSSQLLGTLTFCPLPFPK